jgi:hypothetical protein
MADGMFLKADCTRKSASVRGPGKYKLQMLLRNTAAVYGKFKPHAEGIMNVTQLP